jgi:hypothetical protein
MRTFLDKCRGDIYDGPIYQSGFDEPVPDKAREQTPTKTGVKFTINER